MAAAGGGGGERLAAERRFCERLRGATLEELGAILTEVGREADERKRGAYQTLILEQMARVNPQAAMALLQTMEDGRHVSAFLGAWGRESSLEVYDWIINDGEDVDRRVQSLLAGLEPEQAEDAAMILARLGPGEVREDHVADVFRRLGGEDELRARRLLGWFDEPSARCAAASAVTEGWARFEPESAYAWAKSLDDPAERESALRGVFRGWAETDPQGVAALWDAWVRENGDGATRDLQARGETPVQAIVRAWAAQDPQAAVAWLKERSPDAPREFNQLFASEIVPLKAHWSAAELAELARRPGDPDVSDRIEHQYSGSKGWGNGFTRNTLIGDFGGDESPLGHRIGWNVPPPVVFDDPARAFEELTTQPSDAARQHVLQEVAQQWAEKDPEAARRRLQETDDGLLKLSLINALSNVARNSLDLGLATEVAAAFPQNNMLANSMLSEIQKSIAQRDPGRAQALLAGDLDDAGKRNLAAALAENHASYDPAGAVAWAVGQSDGEVQSAAVRSAVARWADADAYAVSEWLTTQPAGPAREVAVTALVGALEDSAPEDAVVWANSLADSGQLEEEQVRVIERQIRRDPERARRALEVSRLPDVQRARLSQAINDRVASGP